MHRNLHGSVADWEPPLGPEVEPPLAATSREGGGATSGSTFDQKAREAGHGRRRPRGDGRAFAGRHHPRGDNRQSRNSLPAFLSLILSHYRIVYYSVILHQTAIMNRIQYRSVVVFQYYSVFRGAHYYIKGL